MMIKIKCLIYLLATFFSMNALGEELLLNNLKKMQLYLDKNQMEKVEDLYDDNEDVLSKNRLALERLAISFERRELFQKAITIYRKIIIDFLSKQHRKILKTPPSQIEEADFQGTNLHFYYYKLAFLNTQLFSKTHKYTKENDRIRYKNNAIGFIELSRKVKVDEGELKMLLDLLQEKMQIDEDIKFKSGSYFSLDFISWQDRVFLVNKNTSVKNNLLSTGIGSCLGFGKRWENLKYEFDVEGCLAVLSATISAESKDINYQQADVTVKGFLLGPGMYFKTISKNVLLGFHIPVKYSKGDWTNPDESLYRFQKEKSLEVGYFIQSKIKIKNVSLRTRIGKVFPNPGSLWSIGILYNF